MRLNTPGDGLLGKPSAQVRWLPVFPPGVVHDMIGIPWFLPPMGFSIPTARRLRSIFFFNCGRLPYRFLLLIEIVAPVRTPIHEIGSLPSFLLCRETIENCGVFPTPRHPIPPASRLATKLKKKDCRLRSRRRMGTALSPAPSLGSPPWSKRQTRHPECLWSSLRPATVLLHYNSTLL